MTAPSRETREEWRREAQAGEYRHGKDCHWPMPCCCEATRILDLLDALDAAEERAEANGYAAMSAEAGIEIQCTELRQHEERLAAVRVLADVDPFNLIPFGCVPLGDLREALGMDR